MTLYALFLLLAVGQTYTSNTERSDHHILLRQGRREYASGRFAAAQKLFADALLQLPEGNESERAAILADMGAALGSWGNSRKPRRHIRIVYPYRKAWETTTTAH
jgi:hypothetical protein